MYKLLNASMKIMNKYYDIWMNYYETINNILSQNIIKIELKKIIDELKIISGIIKQNKNQNLKTLNKQNIQILNNIVDVLNQYTHTNLIKFVAIALNDKNDIKNKILYTIKNIFNSNVFYYFAISNKQINICQNIVIKYEYFNDDSINIVNKLSIFQNNILEHVLDTYNIFINVFWKIIYDNVMNEIKEKNIQKITQITQL